MSYAQLTEGERYQISALKKVGHTQAKIAAQLKRSESTISREIRRNTGQRGYRLKQANEFAKQRHADKPKACLHEEVWAWVKQLLAKKWSPEQISGWLKKEHSISISHERIYQYIAQDKRSGGELYKHLRCQKKRCNRYGSFKRSQRGQIKGRVSIDERPAIVDERGRVGDWEADTVVGACQGSQPVLVTLTERKTRYTLMIRRPTKPLDP